MIRFRAAACLAAWIALAATGIAGKPFPEFRLRGISTAVLSQSPSGYQDETYFKLLKSWNVNVLRLFINVDPGSAWDVKRGDPLPPIPADDPLLPYRKNLEAFDRELVLAEKYGIRLIPVLGNVAGRKSDVMLNLNDGDPGYYENVRVFWINFARKYAGNPWIAAYDLLNEPNGNHTKIWSGDMVHRVVGDLRRVDSETTVIYEPPPFALPDQAFRKIRLIDDANVVYSFHFYYPHSYTHQGIKSYRDEKFLGKAYPGELRQFASGEPEQWDKAALERSMENVIRFQKENNARIFVGEFGVLRWAPGREQWMRDAVDLFEQHGWDWTMHSIGGWNGWNHTFGPDDHPGREIDGGSDTPVMRILREAWRKNSDGDSRKTAQSIKP